MKYMQTTRHKERQIDDNVTALGDRLIKKRDMYKKRYLK